VLVRGLSGFLPLFSALSANSVFSALVCFFNVCPREGRDRNKDKRKRNSTGRKREDEEVAFAGDDDGEVAAVGRDGEIAKG
jgi:hypothetical protein